MSERGGPPQAQGAGRAAGPHARPPGRGRGDRCRRQCRSVRAAPARRRLGRPDPLDRADPGGARRAGGAGGRRPGLGSGAAVGAGADSRRDRARGLGRERHELDAAAVGAAARHLADLGRAAAGHRAAAPARRARTAGATGRGGACSSRSTSRAPSRRCWPAWPASGSACRGSSSSWRCCRSTRASGPGSIWSADLAGRGFAPYLMFPGYFSRALGPPGTARHGVLSRREGAGWTGWHRQEP